MNSKQSAVVAALLALSLMACSGVCPRRTPSDKSPSTNKFPEKISPTFIYRTAGVDGIEIQISESTPARANVVVKGYLSDSCTKIDRIDQKREGDDFHITITTKRPADRNCLQALMPFEEIIPLEVADLKAGAYTVTVNQMSESFTLQGDNPPRK
jgi:inhibitor of cysteine peptidase